jgi:hypothetical protein
MKTGDGSETRHITVAMARINLVIFFAAIFSGALFLTLHQVYPKQQTVTDVQNGLQRTVYLYPSDTLEHIGFAEEFVEGKRYIPHPLWHLLVVGCARFSGMPLRLSAAVVSSIFLLFWAVLLFWASKQLLTPNMKKYSDLRWTLLLMTVVLVSMVVGPLNFPWLNKFIYIGVGSPNIWHNVTLWTVKPFALAAMLFSVWYLQKHQAKDAAVALGAATLSMFAKPSFIIVFLPALLVYVMLKRNFDRRSSLILGLMTLFTLVILGVQFIKTYGRGAGISVDFLGVWSLSSSNILLSIFLALAFPILLVAMVPEVRRDSFIQLAWLQVFLGISLFAFFVENGDRYAHGNFSWSYNIAMSMLYFFSIVAFVRMFATIGYVRRTILSFLLAVQVGVGSYYLAEIMQGANPLFVNIVL